MMPEPVGSVNPLPRLNSSPESVDIINGKPHNGLSLNGDDAMTDMITALTRIASIARVTDIVDYPATCYTLIESDDAILLPEGVRIAIERKPHRGHRMFSTHQVGFNEEEGAYAFAIGSTVPREPRAKNWLFALSLGQKVEVGGKIYRIADAPNRNIDLIPEALWNAREIAAHCARRSR